MPEHLAPWFGKYRRADDEDLIRIYFTRIRT